jgi:ABC-type glutathione transport system ATPase component
MFTAGDAAFLKKAEKRMVDLIHRSRILAFASHSRPLVELYCDRAIWLDNGEIRQYGPTSEVYAAYLSSIAQVERRSAVSHRGHSPRPDHVSPGGPLYLIEAAPSNCVAAARSSLSVLKFLHLHSKKRPPPLRETAIRSDGCGGRIWSRTYLDGVEEIRVKLDLN